MNTPAPSLLRRWLTLLLVGVLGFLVKRAFARQDHANDLLFRKYDELRDRQNKIDVNMALLAGRLKVRDDEFSDTVVVRRGET